jgi:hypothetical protein
VTVQKEGREEGREGRKAGKEGRRKEGGRKEGRKGEREMYFERQIPSTELLINCILAQSIYFEILDENFSSGIMAMKL